MRIQIAGKRAISLALAGAISLSAAVPSFAQEELAPSISTQAADEQHPEESTNEDPAPPEETNESPNIVQEKDAEGNVSESTGKDAEDNASESTGKDAEDNASESTGQNAEENSESEPEKQKENQNELQQGESQPEEQADSDSEENVPAVQTDAPALSVDDIESVQAFTDATFYGTGVVEVDVTYKEGTDLSGVTTETYVLEDRGSLNAEFGKIDLSEVKVSDNVVALTILRDSDATDANKMIYTGSNKEGSRQRNSYGVYVTGAWYRDAETHKIVIGETGQQGYQARECLELRLRHANEDEDKALCLADDEGKYTGANKWKETVDRQFGEGGFKNLYDLQIPSTGWQGNNGDDFVQGYYYVPENYDPTKGIVFTLQGQGISFWKLEDGTNNAGTGIMFDSATTSWANQGAIVVNIHDRSTTYNLPEGYDFVVDDVNVMKYFIDEYNITGPIVLQGNSRGTMASDIIIKALAGCEYDPAEQKMGTAKTNIKTLDKTKYNFTIDTYICQNGSFGSTLWDDKTGDWETIAKTGLRAWIFDGEQDVNNIETYTKWQETLKKLGMPTDTARLTGLTSDLNYPWGESDHSTTRINGWYFANEAYYGPDLHIDENGKIVYNTELKDGDTYTLKGRGAAGENSKKDYEYTVYDDSFHTWALSASAKPYDPDAPAPTQGDFTRAEAAEAFYNYFGWSHRSEYNDIWSPEMISFDDVSDKTDNWKAIECALQQGLVDETKNYRPKDVITYAEALDMFARAYSVDQALIKKQADLVLSLKDSDGLTGENWNTLFDTVKASFVAPVQALPIANTDDGAPRRYVKLWSPEGEDNVTIYFKKTVSTTGYDEDITLDLSEAKPFDYQATGQTDKSLDATQFTQIYTVNEDGYIKEDYSGNTDTYITYKTVAVDKTTGQMSKERIYKWHLHRPAADDVTYGGYTAVLIHNKTATSPAVYQICRDAESLRAMAWYIEGQDAGVLMDALQTNAYNKDGTLNQWNLKDFVDQIATKPYSLVVGHAHPDHDAQAANFINAGIPTYCNDRNWSSLKSVLKCSTETDEQNNARQAAVLDIDEGDSFDLGGCTLDVYTLPGHLDNLVILADRANGWVFSTDIYGCTRSGSADNVNVAGIPADLLLSLAQQNHSAYEENGTEVGEVYTGHDEVPLTGTILDNFEQCLQNVIDYGDDATSYTLRGGNNKMYARTSMVGDVWKSGTNWLSLLLKGTKGDQSEYLSNAATALYMSDAANAGLNYNFVDGTQQIGKYSVLSNVQVQGGKLNGVDITWKAATTIEWAGEKDVPIEYTLHDRFNPWHYDYNISADGSTISIDATKMATNAEITAITLDGQTVSSLQNMTVKNGSVIAVTVTSPDKTTTSTYNFTIIPAASDLDDVTDLQKDFSQAAQLPLTGYFTKTLSEGRTVKVYIAPEASIRSYFTVVAVPDGVNDTYSFLKENGWIDLADQKGEGLYVLEPGANGWGTAQEEAAYLDSAISFLKSGTNANKQTVFSTLGEFYLAGYGKGAAALELWAAKNPIFVIAQTYMDGQSAGTDTLTAAASDLYDGKSANGDISDVLDETLQKVDIDGAIAPKDVPVPTILAGYTGSEEYWKTANDCEDKDINGVFAQKIDSNAYATEYANSVRKENGEKTGLSQVKIAVNAAGLGNAADIYNYMAQWTRYDTTFAYSNALAERLDYTAARVAAQKQALGNKTIDTLSDGTAIFGQSDVQIKGHGTVQVGVMAFSDNNGDGVNDPREYLLYIPETRARSVQKMPVVMIYPGNTQTDSIFMDSTLWWQIAEKEGVALAFVCETYNANACSVSHADSDKFHDALLTLLKEKIDGKYVNLDFTRVYGSGQSAGSAATQGFAITKPGFFAAVGSTSAAASPNADASNKMIPTMMITGQMDVSDLAKGFDSTSLKAWGNYMVKVNGAGSTFTADSANSCVSADSRHPELYTWNNKDGIPMVRWGQCILRPHNCYPSDIQLLWDFMKHYSMDENGNRYYSVSAFAQNDLVQIAVSSDAKSSSSSSSSSSSKNSSKQESTVYHSVTAIAHEGGTISSKGVFGVVEGTSKYYEISPNAGCTVARVLVDGVDVGAVTNYTFQNIRSNHTIEVFFSGSGISSTGRANPQTGIWD